MDPRLGPTPPPVAAAPRARWRAVGAPAAVAAMVIAVAAAIRWADPSTPGGIIPPCPSKTWLHVVCPGCGSTRAIDALLRLDPAGALAYNALAVLALIGLAVAFAVWTRGRLRGVAPRQWYHRRYAPLIMLVLTLGCNIPVAPLTALRV